MCNMYLQKKNNTIVKIHIGSFCTRTHVHAVTVGPRIYDIMGYDRRRGGGVRRTMVSTGCARYKGFCRRRGALSICGVAASVADEG